ncbi:MAG: TetR family transcriptional regulator [Candidatus Gastranaerophilaceae bacterium]|nr:TetR/AcrR family transcriptional regulator [Christensenellales bacterium]
MEILDIAEHLFETKGFDNTSTNDILNEIGIARGTLYYHFKSKEEILDAIIDRLTKQLLEKAKEFVKQEDVPLSQQLTLIMLELNVSCGNFNHKILEQVHKPQNALMHQKIQAHLLSELTPLISTLIKEGIAQGIYQTDYPEEVAEMLFLYANTIFDDLIAHSKEEKQKKAAAFVFNLERLLKMEQGSMKVVVNSIFQNAENET